MGTVWLRYIGSLGSSCFTWSRSYKASVFGMEDFPDCLCFSSFPFLSFSFFFFFRGWRCCHHKLVHPIIIIITPPISDNGNCRAIVMKLVKFFFSPTHQPFHQLRTSCLTGPSPLRVVVPARARPAPSGKIRLFWEHCACFFALLTKGSTLFLRSPTHP